MCTDLGIEYLDHDFIETIGDQDGLNRYDYLADDAEQSKGHRAHPAGGRPASDVLVLIFEQALGGIDVNMRSTPRLTYCGACPARL